MNEKNAKQYALLIQRWPELNVKDPFEAARIMLAYSVGRHDRVVEETGEHIAAVKDQLSKIAVGGL